MVEQREPALELLEPENDLVRKLNFHDLVTLLWYHFDTNDRYQIAFDVDELSEPFNMLLVCSTTTVQIVPFYHGTTTQLDCYECF